MPNCRSPGTSGTSLTRAMTVPKTVKKPTGTRQRHPATALAWLGLGLGLGLGIGSGLGLGLG